MANTLDFRDGINYGCKSSITHAQSVDVVNVYPSVFVNILLFLLRLTPRLRDILQITLNFVTLGFKV
jgi:hypothetical protein